jgi:hypothetical protein
VAGIVVAVVVGVFVIALGGSMALGLAAQEHRRSGPAESAGSADPNASAGSASGIAQGRRTGSARLHAGDCVRRKGTGSGTGDLGDLGDLDVVSCSTSHDGEVIGTYQVRGKSYPGAKAIVQEAETRCAAFVPVNLVTSDREDLSNDVIYPERATWAAGDRRVDCLFLAGQPLTTPLSEL